MPEPDAKRCTRCGQTKPLTEFNRKDRGRLQGYCRACNSAYLKEHYANNKEYYIAKARKNTRLSKINAVTYIWRYFETHPCVDCGETDPVVLQFDHVRGVKSFPIASMVSTGFSVAKIEAEIEKCEVRCANCHFRKTARERGWYRYMEQ